MNPPHLPPPRPGRPAELGTRLRAGALPLVTALLAVAVLGCGRAASGPPMAAERTLLQLLGGNAGMEVLEERADQPVALETLAPTANRRGDEGPLPAIAMAPRAHVAFQVPRLAPDAELRFAVTVDARSRRAFSSGRVFFRVLLDGQAVFGHQIDLGDGEAPTVWQRGSVPIPRGGRVELRTDWDGRGRAPIAGFGEVEVVAPIGVHRRRATSEHPNLVTILVDTLRADRLGAYGADTGASPVIDALAGDGTVFEQAWAPSPWTWPSTATLFTGLAPPEHGVLSAEACVLPRELTTFAERVQDSGWTTAGFSANPLIAAGQGFGKGFEHYWTGDWDRSPAVLDLVEPVLDEISPWRFYLYLHLTDPHRPYEAEPELVARFAPDAPEDWSEAAYSQLARDLNRFEPADAEQVRRFARHALALYDAEIASTDRAIERLLGMLAARGVLENTLLAFTSDHGEEFAEHGLFAHAHQLYEESLRVPLFLTGPGIQAERRIREPVALEDVPATLLARLGVPARGLRGRDLLAGPLPAAPALFFSTELGLWNEPRHRPLRAILQGERLLIHGPAGPEVGEAVEAFFDLASDPGATQPTTDRDPAELLRLRQAVERWWQEGSARRPTVFGGGHAVDQMLRDIGYLGD